MASPRFVHDAVVVTTPGVTPCHPTAGPAQEPFSPASPAARSPTVACAVFPGMPIGQVVQQEDQLVLEDNGCPGVPGSCQHGPGQPQPNSYHVVARLSTGGLVRGQPAAGDAIGVLRVGKVSRGLHCTQSWNTRMHRSKYGRTDPSTRCTDPRTKMNGPSGTGQTRRHATVWKPWTGARVKTGQFPVPVLYRYRYCTYLHTAVTFPPY